MIKFLTKILIGFFVIFVIFYIFSTGSNLDSSEYYQLKQYQESNTEREKKDIFSVMTYNIGYLSGMTNNTSESTTRAFYEKNLNQVRQVVRQLKPDIIGFQEIDLGAKRSYFQHQLDSIALYAGYASAYQSVNWDKKYVPFPYFPPDNHFGKIISGQAILTYFDLENHKTIVLDKPENNPFYYNAYYIDRLIQIVDCVIENRKVKIMNVHLEAFDRDARMSQAKKVKEIYESFSDEGPVLLIGDFNSEAVSEPEKVSGAIREILSAKNIASAISMEEYENAKVQYYTYSSRDPDRMIDYIFYNPDYIEKAEARVVKEMKEASDHLPVIMTFTFK